MRILKVGSPANGEASGLRKPKYYMEKNKG